MGKLTLVYLVNPFFLLKMAFGFSFFIQLDREIIDVTTCQNTFLPFQSKKEKKLVVWPGTSNF